MANLNKLALIHKTDKFSNNGHSYTPHYMFHFGEKRLKKNLIIEIGIGGYSGKFTGGNSLRMWKNYFPFSEIVGIDIHDKSFHNERRIKTFKGSQNDLSFLTYLMGILSSPDIIIDDGSHMNEDVLKTFNHLFPKLKSGGIYVIEDTQTSY